jgi:hypothetical protein
MRTLAMAAFIAGIAAIAIWLLRRPTVADGRVMELDLLAQLRQYGVVGMACDPRIPLDHRGAVFTCTATLDDGATQRIQYTMDRTGALTAELKSATSARQRRIPASADPWAN